MRIEAGRIAIVRLGAIGDAVNCLPFLNRLRQGYPNARITWLIGAKAHSLLSGHRAIDEFVVFDARRPSRWPAFVREVRRKRFDLVIDLQRIAKSGLIARATGSPRRLGFDRARCKEWSWVFTNLRIPPNPRAGVTVEQYLEFADYLELPRTDVEWNLPYEGFEPLANSEHQSTARDGEPRIVINVGASKPSNRWYPDAFARLCDRLVGELGANVHLSGGREDRAVVDLVLERLHVRVEDHVGRLGLKETAGLIASADLFVGCDTGPLHIAAAVGTPSVALYGASNPRRTGPYGAAQAVIILGVPCSPCMRRTCNVAGHPCMRDLGPDLVFERVRARLAETRLPELAR